MDQTLLREAMEPIKFATSPDFNSDKMTLDHGRCPYHLVTRMEILSVKMKSAMADREVLKSSIFLLNNKIKKISDKIDEIQKDNENYRTIENARRNRISTNEILLLLRQEKNELFLQRNFLDQDLDSNDWRLQDIQEDYSKLVERERELLSMNEKNN